MDKNIVAYILIGVAISLAIILFLSIGSTFTNNSIKDNCEKLGKFYINDKVYICIEVK